jgi:hypothetical protein
MSRLRSAFPHNSRIISKSRLGELIEKKAKRARFNDSPFGESTLFKQTRCRTIESDSAQHDKDQVYNRNITHFRDSFHDGRSNILPFLATLRAERLQGKAVKPGTVPTVTQPFDA